MISNILPLCRPAAEAVTWTNCGAGHRYLGQLQGARRFRRRRSPTEGLAWGLPPVRHNGSKKLPRQRQVRLSVVPAVSPPSSDGPLPVIIDVFQHLVTKLLQTNSGESNPFVANMLNKLLSLCRMLPTPDAVLTVSEVGEIQRLCRIVNDPSQQKQHNNESSFLSSASEWHALLWRRYTCDWTLGVRPMSTEADDGSSQQRLTLLWERVVRKLFLLQRLGALSTFGVLVD